MCERHRYTLIFFERGIISHNDGLKEIKDESFIKRLKYDFNIDYLRHRTYSPMIMGTVVKSDEQSYANTFDRSLRMMRAQVYALLLLASGKEFSDKPELIKDVQYGV